MRFTSVDEIEEAASGIFSGQQWTHAATAAEANGRDLPGQKSGSAGACCCDV